MSAEPPAAPAPRRRRIWRWLLAIVILGLVASEITLREVWGIGTPLIYVVDPPCGYTPAPSQNIRRFGAHNSINSFGMRSPEIARQKPAGVTRILFDGDSVTYGTTYLDQSRIFTSLLQDRLPAAAGGPVEVLNVSAGGWAPANELGFLKEHGTFDADVIVFVTNTRDLTQPFTTIDMGQGLPTHRPFCALWDLAGLLRRYGMARIFHVAPPTDPGASGEAMIDPARDVTPQIATLEEARAWVADHHAQFAVIFTPDRSIANRPDWLQAKHLFDAWAADHQVLVLDMTDAFLAPDAGPIYLDNGNIHLGAPGHELIARCVIEHWNDLIGHRATTHGT